MTNVHEARAAFAPSSTPFLASAHAGSTDLAEALHRALTHLEPAEHSDTLVSDASIASAGLAPSSTPPTRTGVVGPHAASAATAAALGALAATSPHRSLDEASLREIAGALSVSSDPMLMLMSLAETLHRNDAMLSNDDLRRGANESARATKNQHAFRRRAARANRRARRWIGRAPKWVKTLVSSIISAVGILGSAFTGGASLALAIAGSVLILASDLIVKAAKKMGMSDKAAGILGACIQIAGAAMSGCSGLASGSATIAATVGQSVASAIQTAAQVTNLAGGVIGAVQATRGIGGSVMSFRGTDAMLDAEASGVENDRAHAETDDVITRMRESAAAFRAASERLLDSIELQRNRDDAIVAGIGR